MKLHIAVPGRRGVLTLWISDDATLGEVLDSLARASIHGLPPAHRRRLLLGAHELSDRRAPLAALCAALGSRGHLHHLILRPEQDPQASSAPCESCALQGPRWNPERNSVEGSRIELLLADGVESVDVAAPAAWIYDDGVPCAGELSFDADRRTVIFHPHTRGLRPNAALTVVVNAAAFAGPAAPFLDAEFEVRSADPGPLRLLVEDAATLQRGLVRLDRQTRAPMLELVAQLARRAGVSEAKVGRLEAVLKNGGSHPVACHDDVVALDASRLRMVRYSLLTDEEAETVRGLEEAVPVDEPRYASHEDYCQTNWVNAEAG